MYRSFPGALVLLAVLTSFIVIPLQWMKSGHVLAKEDNFDLCALLRDGAMQRLPHLPVEITADIPNYRAPPPKQPSCYLLIADDEEATPQNLSVIATTQRFLSRSGNRKGTDVFVDTWLQESAASGYQLTELQGPWRRAGLLVQPQRPETQQVLIDDDGLVLWITALNIDTPHLQVFAESAALRLREGLNKR